MENENKSEVEQLYVKLQLLFGGNVPWYNLQRQHQDIFVHCINTIMQISALR